MSAINSHRVLESLQKYQGSYFDEEIPGALMCCISQDLIQDPLAVNCRAGHVFEKKSIEDWLKTKKSCPYDHDPVTTTFRNRAFEDNLKKWTDRHLVLPIEPEEVAKNLLTGGPISDRVKAGAHLRFIRTANLTDQVARIMIEMIRVNKEQKQCPEDHQRNEDARLNYLQKISRTPDFLYGEEGVLRDILDVVSSEVQVKLSPRSAKLVQAFEERTKEYIHAFDGRMESSEKRITDALNKRMLEALDKLQEANIRAEEDRKHVMEVLDQLTSRIGRQEVEVGLLKEKMGQFQDQIEEVKKAIQTTEDNYGPLDWTEKLRLVISVVGPVALCALARGCAAYMDNDPNTLFVNQFFKFDFTGIVAGAWRFLQICYAARVGGRPALHKMSERVDPNQLAMAVITASITYQESVTSANANWAARQQRDTIFAQDTTINDLRSNQDFLTRRMESQSDTITELNEQMGMQDARCAAQIERVENGLRQEFNEQMEMQNARCTLQVDGVRTDLRNEFRESQTGLRQEFKAGLAQMQRDQGRFQQKVDDEFKQIDTRFGQIYNNGPQEERAWCAIQ